MATRNLADLGLHLQKIVARLQSNQNLVKLLYYTDKDPYAGVDLTSQDIKDKIYEKLIRVVPRVSNKETSESIIALRIVSGKTNMANSEFKNFIIGIEVFVPMTQWFIKDSNLRPFAIMGEIHKSLNGKVIDGLGKVTGGDFQINFLTDEMSCYEMTYYIQSYD